MKMEAGLELYHRKPKQATDWQISQDVWPDGDKSLKALADYVHGKGLEFGLRQMAFGSSTGLNPQKEAIY